MNVKVIGCEDCPMNNRYYDGWGTCECNHPNSDGQDISNVKDGEMPDWCPLNKEPITIEKV